MFKLKNYVHLLGTPGFSVQLLKNHFTLYQGYVKNSGTLFDELKKLIDEGKQGTPHFAELKRRFGWEFNGMRLHELYFGNIKNGTAHLEQASNLAKKITETFGSYENWEKDFKAIGGMRGIGWALLVKDNETQRLFNIWVNEHDVGHLTGTTPLLVMDVFEHAYMLDYGLKRADYIEAFFKEIHWDVVEKRISP